MLADVQSFRFLLLRSLHETERRKSESLFFSKGCERDGDGPSLGERHAAGKLLTIYEGAQQGASSNLEPKLLHQMKTTFLLFEYENR